MTLTKLLKSHRHKKVFNFIYKNFLVGVHPIEEIERIDSLFYSFWQTLCERTPNSNSRDFLFITKVEDDLQDPPQEIIDVSVYYSEVDELDVIDFVEWEDMLGFNIKNAAGLDDFELLCHILYEIFLFGFSSAEVEKRNKSHRKNWKEIEKEIKDIFNK